MLGVRPLRIKKGWQCSCVKQGGRCQEIVSAARGWWSRAEGGLERDHEHGYMRGSPIHHEEVYKEAG